MTVIDQIKQRFKHTAARLRKLKRVQQALTVLQRRRRRQLDRLHKPPTTKNPPLDIFGVDYSKGRVPYDALKRAGVWDARFSRDRCKSLGLADIPVFFAVDWDATDADKPRIAEYLKGAVSVLGRERVGVYGSFYVVGYMASHKVCDYFWQTYAWSGGFEHDQAHVLQYLNGQSIGGLSLDFNHARSLAWAR